MVGIGGDTPLGNVVQIRAETDPKKIKEFNTYEKRIYREWKEFKNNNKQKVDAVQKGMEIQQLFKSLFGR